MDSYPTPFVPYYSDASGAVVGVIYRPADAPPDTTPAEIAVYGFDGNVNCFSSVFEGCFAGNGDDTAPAGINSSGIYVVNHVGVDAYDVYPWIGYGGNLYGITNFFGPGTDNIAAALGPFMVGGINDADQIVIGVPGIGSWVLSPTPIVPEPTSIILLATVVLALGVAIKRRFSGTAWRAS